MIILGIDPGTTSIGYAILEGGREEPRLLDAGLIAIPKGFEKTRRITELHARLGKILIAWKPGVLAIEEVFFSKNQKTALLVAEARGAILLTTALAGLAAYEYTPLEVKKTIAGYGGADKLQLKKILMLTLPHADLSAAKDDACDAVAIALTHLYKTRTLNIHPVTTRKPRP